MTKFEKATLYISVTAIIISIASPIFTYLLFHPIKEEQKYAGRLHVHESFLHGSKTRSGYRIDMKNVGTRPIKDITISMIVTDESIKLPKTKSEITIVPVSPFTYSFEGNRSHIKIDKVLSKGQEIKAFISGQ